MENKNIRVTNLFHLMTYFEGVIVNGGYIIVAQVQQLNRCRYFYIGAYQALCAAQRNIYNITQPK